MPDAGGRRCIFLSSDRSKRAWVSVTTVVHERYSSHDNVPDYQRLTTMDTDDGLTRVENQLTTDLSGHYLTVNTLLDHCPWFCSRRRVYDP